MSPQQRESLEALSRRLLDFHKVLLDWERGKYEAVHGPVGSPGVFLGLVLDHPQFAWLRQLSGLIVELDEFLAPRSKAGAETADSLVSTTRRLLEEPPDAGTFQRRLAEARDESPDAARMRGELLALLV